jgi:hypothetical protein
MALVRKRTIPTERPPLVGEVRANFWGRVSCCQRCGSLRPYSQVSRLESKPKVLKHELLMIIQTYELWTALPTALNESKNVKSQFKKRENLIRGIEKRRLQNLIPIFFMNDSTACWRYSPPQWWLCACPFRTPFCFTSKFGDSLRLSGSEVLRAVVTKNIN